MSTESQQIIALLTEIRDLLKSPPKAPAAGPPQAAGVNTYTKLKGDAGWGIRCSTPVTPGAQVKVQTKSNQMRTETVDKVLWTGDDRRTGQKVWVCSIVPREKGERAEAPAPAQAEPEPQAELPAAAPQEEEDDVPF